MASDHKQNLEALKGLQRHLSGTLILPQDADYKEARRIWNAMIDKHPAAIVRCATEQDVVHTIKFARDHGLPLSVRSGGHDYAGRSLCNDGLVIDFSGMKAVTVDPRTRTARAQAGATIGDLIGAT